MCVAIRAVGYDLDGARSADVTAEKTATANIKLKKTKNVAAQLTNAELRERMSGNICRCGAYSNIAEAISEVAGRQA